MINCIEWFYSTKKSYVNLCTVCMEFVYHGLISIMHLCLHLLVEVHLKNLRGGNMDLIISGPFNVNL